ncbi:MAG TPA: sugar transferase, partial [Mycobacterium sp.]|nr:sugar transferase [Mycobacterium sp.]
MSHADRTLTIAEESDESVVLRGAVPEPTDPLPQARSSNLRAWQRRYARGLSCSDTGVAAAVLTLAQGLFCGQQAGSGWSLHFDLQCSIVSALLLAAWSVTLSAMGSRSPRILGHGPEEYRRVWTATFTVFGSAAVISVLSPNFEIGARYLAVALPLGVIWLTVNRMLARHYVARRRRHGDCMSSVLAVGNVTSVRALARSLSRHQADGYRVVGICVPGGDGVQIPDIDGIPSYPHHGDICNAVLKSGADTVALTSGHLQPDEIRDLSWRLEQLDVDLELSPGLVDVAPPR